MPWFDETITQETAARFFDELRDYTHSIILNYAREMRQYWPPNPDIQVRKFDPKGVCVHVSDSPSMWNSLHLLMRRVYTSHFMVMCGRHFTSSASSYDLISELPAMILMLFHPDAMVNHSGYLSGHTFGIDLRSTGRLRPFAPGVIPPPIMPMQERDEIFSYDDEEYAPDLHIRPDLWRMKFDGNIMRVGNMYYEQPTRAQIRSMLILMKALNSYTGGRFEKRFIFPANCVSATQPQLAFIPWDLVRKIVVDDAPIPTGDGESDWIRQIFSSGSSVYETDDLDEENDGTIAEQLDPNRWRGEVDDGQLLYLETEKHYTLAKGYHRILAELGYHAKSGEDCDFAMQLYAIARNLTGTREATIYSKFQNEYPR